MSWPTSCGAVPGYVQGNDSDGGAPDRRSTTLRNDPFDLTSRPPVIGRIVTEESSIVVDRPVLDDHAATS